MQVYTFPDPVLHEVCEPVEPGDETVLRYVDNMFKEMYGSDGVGLAGPQVGLLKRMVVIDTDYVTEDEDGELLPSRPLVLINPEIIEQLDGTNPLPASIDVSLADPQKVDEIAAAIEADETFRSICDEPDNPADSLKYGQKTVDRLFSVTKYVRYLGVALVLLLVFIALVFINNTIRLAIMARRKEIAIMRLVGASNGFIRGPFLMEGALHALIGSLLAVGVLQVLRMYGIPKLQSALSFLSLDVSGNTYIMIYIVLVVAGLVIGLLGSAFAMRRYLKV